MSDWQPAVMKRHSARRPPVGVLIGHQHKVWRVLDVVDVERHLWSEKAEEAWARYRFPDPMTWNLRPFRVIVERPDGGRQAAMTIQPQHMILWWFVVPDHYAVCRSCGEPSPCREYLDEEQATKEMAAAAEEMSLPDGFCPGCREPITSRQKVHAFPGENLLNPLGAPDVRFHARRKCRWHAAQYEERWVRADPTRPRSLLTLRCTGRLVVHGDGTAECHRRDGSDCPTVYARHEHLTSCYLLSAGCPRGCVHEGHPGCHPAPDLTPDGRRA